MQIFLIFRFEIIALSPSSKINRAWQAPTTGDLVDGECKLQRLCRGGDRVERDPPQVW